MDIIIMVVVWIIATALLAVIAYAGIPALARKHLFFTMVNEGKIKVVMKGGRAHRFIASIKDHCVDSETGEVYSTQIVGPPSPTTQKTPKPFWEEMFGVRFIGIPPVYNVYTYEFHWNKYVTGTDGKHKMVHKDAPTEFLYFRAPYVIEIPNLETKDRRRVTLLVQFVTETMDARLSLFSTPNWLAIVESAVIAALRDYVANKDFDALLNEPKELGGDFVSSVGIIDQTGVGNQPLSTTVGQKLQSINLLSIEPDDKDAIAAMEQKKIESDLADAAVQKARGTEAEGTAAANNEKKSLQADMEALGPHGGQIGMIRLARAIEQAKTQTVVLGNGAMPTVNTKP
ncbi:MAG: hypothetical protein WCP24_01130 [bacterium]